MATWVCGHACARRRRARGHAEQCVNNSSPTSYFSLIVLCVPAQCVSGNPLFDLTFCTSVAGDFCSTHYSARAFVLTHSSARASPATQVFDLFWAPLRVALLGRQCREVGEEDRLFAMLWSRAPGRSVGDGVRCRRVRRGRRWQGGLHPCASFDFVIVPTKGCVAHVPSMCRSRAPAADLPTHQQACPTAARLARLRLDLDNFGTSSAQCCLW